jgi:hypothetical protein
MEPIDHDLCALFAQLGLPSQPDEVRAFIQRHRPLANGVRLHEAGFWTPAQAALLRDALQQDSDWSGVVDRLNAALHP